MDLLAWVIGLVGAALVVWAFMLKGLPTLTVWGSMAGFILVVIGLGIGGFGSGGGGCYIDWDGRSNSTVCD